MYNLIQIGIFLFFFTIFKKKKLFGASYIKKKSFNVFNYSLYQRGVKIYYLWLEILHTCYNILFCYRFFILKKKLLTQEHDLNKGQNMIVFIEGSPV